MSKQLRTVLTYLMVNGYTLERLDNLSDKTRLELARMLVKVHRHNSQSGVVFLSVAGHEFDPAFKPVLGEEMLSYDLVALSKFDQLS